LVLDKIKAKGVSFWLAALNKTPTPKRMAGFRTLPVIPHLISHMFRCHYIIVTAYVSMEIDLLFVVTGAIPITAE
jgi:hypothetical protein